MISRTWKGDWRVRVVNPEGNLVWVASGKTRDQALKEADSLIETARTEGRAWAREDAMLSSPWTDIDALASNTINYTPQQGPDFSLAAALHQRGVRNAKVPSTLRERQGVQGYKVDYTKEELRDQIAQHVDRYQTFMADLSSKHVMTKQLDALRLEDPQAFKILNARLQDLAGQPLPMAQWMNDVTDRLLAPALGKNSATKLAAALNTTVFSLQLGMGNLMFPVLNALTFGQTVLPHLAFLSGSPTAAAAKYYGYQAFMDGGGKIAGSMGILQPFRIVGQSFKEMGNPDAGLLRSLERAMADGVTDPRLVEEFVGKKAITRQRFEEALQGKGLVDFMGSISSFLPSATERFSRTQAFVTGHIFARDVLGLTDDALYGFAKEFTNNTMFQYSTAHRARVITGPMGSMLGMFKNWPMHYIGWMMEYVGQGVKHNNWAPLLYMMGGTGATGGMAAMPFFGMVDQVQKLVTDKSIMEHIYGSWEAGGDQGWMSDVMYYGLPAFLGVSMQASASAPTADPAMDVSMMFSIAHWNRMKAVGEAIGSTWQHFNATGDHPASNEQTRDALIRAFAPKSLQRVYASIEDQYVRSLTSGYPQAELSAREKLAYMAGFNPTRLERHFEVSRELWNDQNKLRVRVQTLGRQFAEAQKAGDSREMEKVILAATAENVPIDSVMKSAQTRMAKDSTDALSRQFDMLDIERYRPILGQR